MSTSSSVTRFVLALILPILIAPDAYARDVRATPNEPPRVPADGPAATADSPAGLLLYPRIPSNLDLLVRRARERQRLLDVPVEAAAVARPATLSLRQGSQPNPRASGRGGKWKWVLIGSGAAAGGAAAAILMRRGGSSTPPTPVITIGPPTIGGPQ